CSPRSPASAARCRTSTGSTPSCARTPPAWRASSTSSWTCARLRPTNEARPERPPRPSARYFLPLLRPIRHGVGPSNLRQALVQRVGQHVVLRAVQLDVAVEVGLDAPGGFRSAERGVAQPAV